MHFSAPSLHPRVFVSTDHKTAMEKEFSLRLRPLRRFALAVETTPAGTEIPVTTVSLNSNFDSYIDVWFKGAPAASAVKLLVDTGNTTLVVPDWKDIEAFPNWSSDYAVLGTSS